MCTHADFFRKHRGIWRLENSRARSSLSDILDFWAMKAATRKRASELVKQKAARSRKWGLRSAWDALLQAAVETNLFSRKLRGIFRKMNERLKADCFCGWADVLKRMNVHEGKLDFALDAQNIRGEFLFLLVCMLFPFEQCSCGCADVLMHVSMHEVGV